MNNLIIPLLILLCSCMHTSQWKLSYIEGGNEGFNSSRLSYQTRDPVNGADLEFLCVNGQIYTYLQVHGRNLKKGEATLIIGDILETFTAMPHRGGQRVCLPEEYQEKIIAALKEGHSVSLQIDGYQAAISPDAFNDYFKKLRRGPSLLNSLPLY